MQTKEIGKRKPTDMHNDCSLIHRQMPNTFQKPKETTRVSIPQMKFNKCNHRKGFTTISNYP